MNLCTKVKGAIKSLTHLWTVEVRWDNRKDNMRAAYRLVGTIAAARGWTIAETQAAVWCGVCKSNGVRPGSFADSIRTDSQTSFDF